MHGMQTPAQFGQRGYEGHLNFQVVSLAELLQDAGYHTYMVGKWHLDTDENTGPKARGFDRSFAILQGGGGHFDMLPIVGPGKAKYSEDGKIVDALPHDFYSTKFYTEKLINHIDSNHPDRRPFFGYLAYTAPHWPLQAPSASIQKYNGKYDDGYAALQQQRLDRLKALELVPKDFEAYPNIPDEPAWESLTGQEKKIEARKSGDICGYG